MAACRAGSRCSSQVDGASEQPSGAGSSSLLASATTWPLKRYGRFLSPTDKEDGERSDRSWQVFESNEESGHLILTIVVSGHFFISQGRTVLEGFSLIDSQKWLRIARRADCLLLHAQSKNECRMFRVQFGGDSEEQTLEHCCSCVQKLTEYVPVHEADELSQNLCYSHSQVEDTEQNTSALHVADEPLPDSFTNFGERRSTMQLAQVTRKDQIVWVLQVKLRCRESCFVLMPKEKPDVAASLQNPRGATLSVRDQCNSCVVPLQSVLSHELELPLVYRHSAWSARDLGPFIRLCLMDQHFPAFVEDVEKELKKLTEG
ncbi:meiotic recombination protein REC114 [Coturnix japonica]|uniref:meiotic recombination protein REC114 n=1 Tax=Coturnix japonica TaxID=93934 RepID=UPI0013A5E17D|nr:meiotic recombination protein REC114 [Coturnix japonica]